VFTLVEGARHRLGHLDLAGPLGSAEGGDGEREQLGDGLQGATTRVEMAGSPADSFRPSHGMLVSPAATRARASARSVDATTSPPRTSGTVSSRPLSLSAGGRPAGKITSSTMVPDGLA
jgi:hypothetical protein